MLHPVDNQYQNSQFREHESHNNDVTLVKAKPQQLVQIDDDLLLLLVVKMPLSLLCLFNTDGVVRLDSTKTKAMKKGRKDDNPTTRQWRNQGREEEEESWWFGFNKLLIFCRVVGYLSLERAKGKNPFAHLTIYYSSISNQCVVQIWALYLTTMLQELFLAQNCFVLLSDTRQ